MGAAVVLDTLLLLDGFGRGQATRYISQDPRKRSQFCYGGLQVGIFTLWLFSVCVCVCVCACVKMVTVMMVQRVKEGIGIQEVGKWEKGETS